MTNQYDMTSWDKPLTSDDRVLITGPTGWFGRTATVMAHKLGVTLLPVSSRSTVYQVDGVNVSTVPHELALISDFAPTVVIDSAFITREQRKNFSLDDYVSMNRKLIRNSVEIASLPSVQKYVGFSSGATVNLAGHESFDLIENPYAALKGEYEREMVLLNQARDVSISIARVWSVSGEYVTKPNLFAFSNLISQAKNGVIEIQAQGKVFRRYCALGDVLTLALAQSKQAGSPIFDTGGELSEIGDLAQTIRDEVNPRAQITRNLRLGVPDDNYFSDGTQWHNLLNFHGLAMESIRSQVIRVASFLSKL